MTLSQHATTSAEVGRSSFPYTVSSQYIVRHDPQYYSSPFTLFNIYTGDRYALNATAYAILSLLEINAMTCEQLADYLTGRFNHLTYSTISKFAYALVQQGVLVPSLHGVSRRALDNHRYVHTEIATAPAVPVAASPVYAEIHFTNACNLACKHCAYDSGRKLAKQLNVTTWIELFDQLEQLKIFSVQLSGGEPLTYPGTRKILRQLSFKRLRVDFLTNGTLIDGAIAECLAAPHFSTIVSLDGADSATHAILRGNRFFEATIRGLKFLSKARSTFHISATLHKQNAHQVERMTALACELGARSINFTLLDTVGRATRHSDLWLAEGDIERISTAVAELKASLSGEIQIGFLNPSEPNYADAESDSSSDAIYCSAGTSRAAIRSDGMVFPCVYAFHDDFFAMGQIDEEPISTIWTNKKWTYFRGETRLRDLTVCGSCPMVDSCVLKRCRLRAYHRCGDFFGRPSGCPRSTGLGVGT